MESIFFIYKVTIFADGSEHYFGSLAAIYTELTKEQIGCRVEHLWNSHIDESHPFSNSRCLIEKVKVRRMLNKDRRKE